MATGIQAAWSTTPATNATADSQLGPREGWAPSVVNDTIRSIMSIIKKLVLDWQGGLVTGGSSTAYTVTTQGGIALTDGMSVTCRIHVTNGVAPAFERGYLGLNCNSDAPGDGGPGRLPRGRQYPHVHLLRIIGSVDCACQAHALEHVRTPCRA